jgi:hypothetical protein
LMEELSHFDGGMDQIVKERYFNSANIPKA